MILDNCESVNSLAPLHNTYFIDSKYGSNRNSREYLQSKQLRVLKQPPTSIRNYGWSGVDGWIVEDTSIARSKKIGKNID